ncbi:hypothetical protein GGX14DRAFT_408822 [Mycena pura]|uniref:Uncharacterized protein n=1 Tax=Mycena pura TaxID=153505 RepID=A0AAD6UK99_9AGAR|nr:hypothetical protein GGX14DRAFT_408822 [Mycena pura]
MTLMSLLAGLAGLRRDASLHDPSFAQLFTFTHSLASEEPHLTPLFLAAQFAVVGLWVTLVLVGWVSGTNCACMARLSHAQLHQCSSSYAGEWRARSQPPAPYICVHGQPSLVRTPGTNDVPERAAPERGTTARRRAQRRTPARGSTHPHAHAHGKRPVPAPLSLDRPPLDRGRSSAAARRATECVERSSSRAPYRPAPLRSGSTSGSASRTRPQTRSASISASASASHSRSGSRSRSCSPGPRTPVNGLPPLLELGLVRLGKGFAGREDGRARRLYNGVEILRFRGAAAPAARCPHANIYHVLDDWLKILNLSWTMVTVQPEIRRFRPFPNASTYSPVTPKRARDEAADIAFDGFGSKPGHWQKGKAQYLNQFVIGAIYEYLKQVTKSPENGSKNRNFAHL